MSSVRLPKGLSANNIIVTPTRGPSRPKNRKRNATPSPIPKARPTTRADIEGTKDIDYDMKHHPMDDTLRPKAAAKRAAVNSSGPSMNGKGSNRSSVSSGIGPSIANLQRTASKSTGRKTPAKQDLSTLLDKPLEYTWLNLAELDRRIFRLQAGAPANGKTLPLKWPELADRLDHEGLLTETQLKACGGVKALINRYELVRLHVQNLFGAADEANNRNDFKILHAEGFDVYDLVGSKAEYFHVKNRDPAPEYSAKKTKFGHWKGSGADEQMDSGIAGDAEDTEAFFPPKAERMLSRSESEESEEISWEEQIWGPGGIRPEELDENGDYLRRMEQSREDVSALIDDVMMSRDQISKVYEEDMSQMQPTDIILSDCATNSDHHSTGIAERETQKSASVAWTDSTVGPNLSNFAVPVANMTANMPDPATGLLGEQVIMSVSNGHLTGFANQFSFPGTPLSDFAEREREKLRKIHEFAKVLEHGQYPPNQMATKEKIPTTAGTSASVEMISSDQLVKDLETQASREPEPATHTFTRQIRAKPDVTSFQVFEDQAGRTPIVKKSVILHPLSPGTDVPKENFEGDSDIDNHTSQLLLETFGARNHETQLHGPGVTASPSVAENTPMELALPAHSQFTRSLFGPFAQGANRDSSANIATSPTPQSSILHIATGETITSTSGDGSHVSSGGSLGGQKQSRSKASDFM